MDADGYEVLEQITDVLDSLKHETVDSIADDLEQVDFFAEAVEKLRQFIDFNPDDEDRLEREFIKEMGNCLIRLAQEPVS